MEAGDAISLVQLAPDPAPASLLKNRYAEDLAVLLNKDEELGRSLGRSRHSSEETASTVLSHAQTWCDRNTAIFFAIVLDQASAIGTISLSHLDLQKRSARTGYWIGTRFQGHGYAGAAFHRLIAFARSLGVGAIVGQIAADNHASRRIWERNGADIMRDGAMLRANITVAR